jgi:hypothetical protein
VPVRSQVPAAHLLAAPPLNFSAIVPASSQVQVADQARATLHPNCQLVQAVEPTLAAQDDQAVVGLAILVGPDSRAIDLVTSADLAHLAIDRVTLADRADLVTALATLADRVDRAIGPVTSAVRGDPAIALATLAVPANQAEIMSKTSRAALAIAKAGRTGVRSIVMISATGGRTTPAISTIGSTTVGGTTTTSTTRTILGSVSGLVPLGAV